MSKKEKEMVDTIYNQLIDIIHSSMDKKNGFKVEFKSCKGVVKKISIRLQNDGIFFDEENGIILLDDELIKRYNMLVKSVCSRRCSKSSKGKCVGCIEHTNTSKIALNSIQDVITL